MFDPYLQWLGIAKNQRPITYYRLLGLTANQADDPDAVDEAAAAIAKRVKQHADGPHAEIAARVLRELAQARAVLANPAKRLAYDARLKKAAAPKPAAPANDDGFEIVDETPAETVEAEIADDEEEEAKPKVGKKKRAKEREPEKKKKPVLLFIALGVGLLLVLGGGAVAAILIFSKTEEKTLASTPTTKNDAQVGPAKPTEKEKPKADPPKPDVPKADPPKPTPPTPAPPKPEPPKPPAPKPVPPKIVKQPVPNTEALDKAEKALKDAWKAEYAKTKPDDRMVLSAKFLVPGREDRKDAAAWFVLLQEARDLAVEAKRPRLAFEAIADMEKYFIVDAVDMRLKVIADITKGGTEFSSAALFRAAANLVQQAYSEENFDAAKRYLDAVEGTVRENKAEQSLKRLRELRAEHGDYVREFETVKAAREKLKASPEDPDANTTLGRFLCFFQGDWDKGLPMLAKGSDKALKDSATKDLANPQEDKAQLAVADSWWNWRERMRERGQLIAARRARMWYERAGVTAKDLDRQHIIERLLEAQRNEIIRFQRLLPGSFYGRNPEDRVLLLREGGGNLQTEEAVERGLEWLAAHQEPNGSWHTHIFHTTSGGTTKKCNCTEESDKEQKHDVAGTALGLMPFIGAGYTHKPGNKYATTVYRGVYWLLKKQNQTDGFFDGNNYENALAATCIIELYGMTKDKDLALPAQGAANYICAAQAQDGSWNYAKAQPKGDLSVTGWQFTALKSAAYAGLRVDQAVVDKLSKFLDTVSTTDGTGYGYNAPSNAPATSAVGILCREFLSWGPGHPGLKKAVDTLLQPGNYLTKDKNTIYAAYYITQVAHHIGGEHWEKWNNAVRDVLIEFQDKGDKVPHQKGSFSPRGDAYAKQGGRLMYTSLSLIMLEAYYYHVPLYGYGPYVLLD